MFSSRSFLARVGTLLVTLLVPACAALFGLDELTDRDASKGKDEDAATDAASVIADAAPDGRCDTLVLPSRPSAAVAQGDIDLTFAVDRFELARPPSFNLDGRCTSVAAESSCSLPAGGSPDTWVDDLLGADVAGNRILSLGAQFFPSIRPENIAASLAYGYATLLLKISRWNGTPDDDLVGLTVYPSRGLEDPTRLGVVERRVPDPGNESERWVTNANVATTGYLSGGRLVASFTGQSSLLPVLFSTVIQPSERPPLPGTPLRAADAGEERNERPLTIEVRSAWVVADLVGFEAGTPRLENGTIAGRVDARRFVGEAARVRDVARDAQAACTDGRATLELLHRNLCAARDLRTDGTDDGSLACDGLSIAMGFAARRAMAGAAEIRAIFDPCPAFESTACDGEPPVPVAADASRSDAAEE